MMERGFFMSILVTGGAGYIGSHTCIELLQAGYEVCVIDNLCNSRVKSLERVQEITGKTITFYEADLLDRVSLEIIFQKEQIDAVLHFAGLKAVGESVAKPLWYYQNNITGTLLLCEMMQKYKVKNMVFSSSATVYGNSSTVPIREDFALAPTNPYGCTKWMIEKILLDLYKSDPAWDIAILRYFNPVGAHPSGLIGENPNGIPNNLLPYIAQVAVGKFKFVNIFGNDYPTKDGTGVRDYIHVVDLALGHLKALEKLKTKPGIVTYNLGTGQGYSVLEMIAAFSKASGRSIPNKVANRRSGDIAVCYADPTKAGEELGWHAEKGIEDMCNDAWHWQSMNPDGFTE